MGSLAVRPIATVINYIATSEWTHLQLQDSPEAFTFIIVVITNFIEWIGGSISPFHPYWCGPAVIITSKAIATGLRNSFTFYLGFGICQWRFGLV